MTEQAMFDTFNTYPEKKVNERQPSVPYPALSARKDLLAFMLLDRLVPTGYCMISAAEHDQIWLGVDTEALAEVISDDDIRQLILLGVFIQEESLTMFV